MLRGPLERGQHPQGLASPRLPTAITDPGRRAGQGTRESCLGPTPSLVSERSPSPWAAAGSQVTNAQGHDGHAWGVAVWAPLQDGLPGGPNPPQVPHIRPRAGAQRAFAKGIGSFVTPARRSWARCREGQGVRGDKQRAAVAGGPGDGRYPSAAAQAVFVRLVPPAAVGVALMEAEGRVTQRAALPPSLPGEAGPRLPADRPPATGRAAGHGEDHRSGAGPPVRGRAAGHGQGRRSGAGPPCRCSHGSPPTPPVCSRNRP